MEGLVHYCCRIQAAFRRKKGVSDEETFSFYFNFLKMWKGNWRSFLTYWIYRQWMSMWVLLIGRGKKILVQESMQWIQILLLTMYRRVPIIRALQKRIYRFRYQILEIHKLFFGHGRVHSTSGSRNSWSVFEWRS